MSLSPLDSELLDASKKGDSTRVETLLQDGADVNAVNGSGSAPLELHWASHYGHTEVVSILLQNGADVNAVTNYGSTTLHWASWNNQKEVVDILLRNGAIVNAVDSHGNAPLHDACRRGHNEVVAILLQRGADVNSQNRHGHAAMHYAKREGYSNIVTLLEKHQFQQNIAAILKKEPAVPEALWSRILGRVIGHPELVYNALGAKPDLFRRDESKRQNEEVRTQEQPTTNSSTVGFHHERAAKRCKLHKH